MKRNYEKKKRKTKRPSERCLASMNLLTPKWGSKMWYQFFKAIQGGLFWMNLKERKNFKCFWGSYLKGKKRLKRKRSKKSLNNLRCYSCRLKGFLLIFLGRIFQEKWMELNFGKTCLRLKGLSKLRRVFRRFIRKLREIESE